MVRLWLLAYTHYSLTLTYSTYLMCFICIGYGRIIGIGLLRMRLFNTLLKLDVTKAPKRRGFFWFSYPSISYPYPCPHAHAHTYTHTYTRGSNT